MRRNKSILRYLPVAIDDLAAILDWIARDNPIRAREFIEKLDGRIGALENQPLLGRLPRNERLKEAGYRVLILDPYLLFCVIRGPIVEVHRVIHGGRLMDDIL